VSVPGFAADSVGALLLARAEDDNPALLFEDQRWTWREFVSEAAVRARMLTELRRPSRPWHIGVLMDNEPEYLLLIAGAALCGATIVGINATRRGGELESDIAHTDVQAVITAGRHRDLLEGLDLGSVPVYDADSSAYRDVIRTGRRTGDHVEVPDGAAHTLLLLFTSGSTGAPKAVICSSLRLAIIGQLNVHQLGPEDVAYCAMPLFHGNALMAAWAPTLVGGGTFALRSRFSASGFLPDVQKFGATFFNYVGRSLSYVLAQPESSDEHNTRLRLGFGTEASTRDRHEFERRFGCPVMESYGSSEGVCAIVRAPDTPDGALGRPAPEMGLEILDTAGSPCPPAHFDESGQLTNAAEAIGEIVVRGGRARFEGYYGNAEATAARLHGDDYWTSDLAYCDEDGYYWFAGRTADWIRVDSENFATAPIERIVARYPGTITAAAYAVPDPRTGDRVMTTLLLEPDAVFDPVVFAEFLDVQRDLSPKWRPTLVRVARDLPQTATRKVDKPALRRQAWLSADPVFEWSGSSYEVLDNAGRDRLAASFAEHDRSALFPHQERQNP